jgi:hypothetical protein
VVRQALAAWAASPAGIQAAGGLSVAALTDLAPGMSGRSPADRRVVHESVMAMLRAGELVRVGMLPRAGRYGRPKALYGVPRSDAPAHEALALVLAAWR